MPPVSLHLQHPCILFVRAMKIQANKGKVAAGKPAWQGLQDKEFILRRVACRLFALVLHPSASGTTKKTHLQFMQSAPI